MAADDAREWAGTGARQEPPARLTSIAAAGALFLFGVAVFLPTVRYEFVAWDDGPNVAENPLLNPVTWANLAQFWKTPYYGVYAPMTRTLWSALSWVAGGSTNPLPYHLANVVVHGLNVVLVYAILRLLVRRQWPAAAGALVFAVHPLQVEPVAWVTAMKDLLGALFSLLAIWQYLLFAMAERYGRPPQYTRTHYGVAAICFVFALLAKPSATTVPIIAWVLDVAAVRRPARKPTLALLPWLVAAIPIPIITSAAEHASSLVPHVPLWARPFVVCDALAFYLWKVVFPAGLAMDYGRTPSAIVHSPWIFVSWLAPLLLAVAAWRAWRPASELTAAIGAFVAALLPVLGLVPFAYQSFSTVSDRYAYVAFLGPALVVAWLLTRWRGTVGAVVVGCLLGILAAGSMIQSPVWSGSRSLFEHALAVNPGSSIANNNLGVLEMEAGRDGSALAHYQRALRTAPQYPEANYNMGFLLSELGRYDEAAPYFQALIRVKPDYAMAYNNLGVIAMQTGKLDEARQYFEKALQLQPDLVIARNNLELLRQQAPSPRMPR